MLKEKTFLNIIAYAPLFLLPLFVAILFSLFYQNYTKSFELNLSGIEKDLLSIEKKAVENKVLNMTDLIGYKKSEIKNQLTSRVQNRVETAFNVATNLYNENKASKTDIEIKKMIKDALRPFLWNDGESFIWIIDYDGLFELAPHYLTHLEGSSIVDFKDATGRDVIKEEIEIAKDKGYGFLWDTFTKPQDKTNKQYEQVAFVKDFGHFGWYFGSAEYLDTATKKTDEELFSIINQVDNIGNNYVFIINTKGDILVNRYVPQFVGYDINITNKLVKDTISFSINSLKNIDRTSYLYDWYNKTTKKIEKKYAYLQKIPNTDWIIGSGFLLSDINNKLMKQKVAMYETYNAKAKNIFYIAILMIILALILSFLISQKIKKSFTQYKVIIGDKTTLLEELNHSLEQKVIDRTAELETLATTDALTNINNRYSIMNILSSEINRSNRYGQPLSALMYDIDLFKKINDTYGHNVGDAVLTSLSNLVKSTIRDVDMIGRYGGEEFLVVMPNTILDDAKNYAERLRKTVEEYNFEEVGNITISIGIAQLESNETIDEIFKRVDGLLYISKETGRNRISF